ncbi:hypothetical protein [Sphingobium sp. EM0848]|uniref:hypothetical protein n=1 Tax=Sphingobium sp. EM0848 TaxID=2743473 RepID=UPI00159CA333|nr:hypothetical protein [Sphingobium sp. EM0848]
MTPLLNLTNGASSKFLPSNTGRNTVPDNAVDLMQLHSVYRAPKMTDARRVWAFGTEILSGKRNTPRQRYANLFNLHQPLS